MKITQEQRDLIQRIQETILEAEDVSYKERLTDASLTANGLAGLIYKWLGNEPNITDLVKTASRTERKQAEEALKKIGYKMTVRTKGDLILADLIETLYWQSVRDATFCENTIELLKIELEEITGNRPRDGGTFNPDNRKASLQEQGLVIGTALFSCLKSGLIRGNTTIEITKEMQETYLRRSQAAYKRVLYTADTYYQNKSLTPEIEVKTAEKPVLSDEKESILGKIKKAKTGRKYIWVTAHDKFVCADCDALDGRVFDYDEAEEGVTYPPLHPNCRCVAIEVEEGGKE